MQCHPKIHLPFSITHLYYLSVFYQQKICHYFKLPLDKNIILLITHLKFLRNMWLTSARKSDCLARSYFLKEGWKLDIFGRIYFSSWMAVFVWNEIMTHCMFHFYLLHFSDFKSTGCKITPYLMYQRDTGICIYTFIGNYHIDYQKIFSSHHAFLENYQLLQDYWHIDHFVWPVH